MDNFVHKVETLLNIDFCYNTDYIIVNRRVCDSKGGITVKKYWVYFSAASIICLSAFLLVIIGCDSDDDGGGGSSTKWTVMMYGAGNNNLDVSNNNTSFIIQDVQDMEKVGSQTGMEIIAMVASERTGGRAKYYHIEYYPSENPDQISSTMLEDKGTKDMSDPATLREFINYCEENYPAQNYLLIVDDHGAGWPGSCTDELNGGGGDLTMPELKNAIAQSELQHVDIVCFHACLMAMVEVGYELREVADYMTACQFTMPMQNVLGADRWLGWLKDNTSAAPSDLAQKIAEKVSEAAEAKQKTTHYAMINLSYMQELGARIGSFGNVLVTEGAQHWDEVVHAWGETHFTQYDNFAYVDLREFTNKIQAEPNLSQINLINNAASDVRNLLNADAAVPYTNVYVAPGDPNVPRGGLNIHFPAQFEDFDSTNYVTLNFRQTNWHAFLSTFLRSTGGQTAGCPTTCAEAGVIQVGQAVTQCQFSDTETEHWFTVVLNPGSYRFQLGDFPTNADYDFYTYIQCSDYPNGYTTCSSEEEGPEDMICTTGETLQIYILVRAYQGPMGGYTFLITPAQEPQSIDLQELDTPGAGSAKL